MTRRPPKIKALMRTQSNTTWQSISSLFELKRQYHPKGHMRCFLVSYGRTGQQCISISGHLTIPPHKLWWKPTISASCRTQTTFLTPTLCQGNITANLLPPKCNTAAVNLTLGFTVVCLKPKYSKALAQTFFYFSPIKEETGPYNFTEDLECYEPLQKGLEWKLLYNFSKFFHYGSCEIPEISLQMLKEKCAKGRKDIALKLHPSRSFLRSQEEEKKKRFICSSGLFIAFDKTIQ